MGFGQQLAQLILLLLQLLHPPAGLQLLSGSVEHGAAIGVGGIHRQQLLLHRFGVVGVDAPFKHLIHLALHQR